MVHMKFVVSITRLKALQAELLSQMKICCMRVDYIDSLCVFSQMNNSLYDVRPKYLYAKLEMSALLTGTFIKLIP